MTATPEPTALDPYVYSQQPGHDAQFRKKVATLIDGGRLSARIGADHLGHTNVSMTQDKYMARGRSHIEVAELLDRAINGE